MNAASGAVAEGARQRLHQVYAAKPRSQTFEEFAASQHWSVPAAAPVPRASQPGAYAGSAACRPCHAAEFRNWQSTGMAKMFRPYSPGDVMGSFSGEEILAAARVPAPKTASASSSCAMRIRANGRATGSTP
jgi:hypothetical protein